MTKRKGADVDVLATPAPQSDVVHFETRVQTYFGVVDADGNAVVGTPVEVTVRRFSRESFVEVYEKIQERRLALAEQRRAEVKKAETKAEEKAGDEGGDH